MNRNLGDRNRKLGESLHDNAFRNRFLGSIKDFVYYLLTLITEPLHYELFNIIEISKATKQHFGKKHDC